MNIKKFLSVCIVALLCISLVSVSAEEYDYTDPEYDWTGPDGFIEPDWFSSVYENALVTHVYYEPTDLFEPILVFIPYTSEYFSKPIEEITPDLFPEADIMKIEEGTPNLNERYSYRKIKLYLNQNNMTKLFKTGAALKNNSIISDVYVVRKSIYMYKADEYEISGGMNRAYCYNDRLRVVLKEGEEPWRPLVEDFELEKLLYIDPVSSGSSDGNQYRFYFDAEGSNAYESLVYRIQELKKDERVEEVYLDVVGSYDIPVYGDVNDDGVITAGDALLALQMAVGKIKPESDKALQAADLNFTLDITSDEALAILQKAVGKTPSFSAEN